MKIIFVADGRSEGMPENVPVKKEPVIFLKPDSSLLKNERPFYIPDFSSEIYLQMHIIVKINRLGKNIAERFASRYYHEISLGFDFTAMDIFEKLRDGGCPWELSKSFDNSTVLGTFISCGIQSGKEEDFSFKLLKNETVLHSGTVHNLFRQIDSLIAYLSRFYTLKIGDILFAGSLSYPCKVAIGDRFSGILNENALLDISIK